MNENISRFDTLKLATQYWHGNEELTKIIIFSFLLIFTIIVAGGLLLQRFLQRRNAKLFFERFAKNKGLTDKEIQILWTYANEMDRDPMLALEFKAPFEKVVDLYLKENPKADENLIQDMRKKLDFVIQSPYIPIVSTKDIEIFQNGRMIFANNKSISVALYDKDERFMYWLVVDNNIPLEVSARETVKIVFIRNEDGIYTVTVPIEEIKKENGKTLIKLPHTFELHRTQRREFPRVRVNQPAKIFFNNENDETIEIDAQLEDISAGGGRLCFDKKNDFYKKIRFGDEIKIKFNISDQEIEVYLKILDKNEKGKVVCIRGLFSNIDEFLQEKIMDFVQRELLKSTQLKKGS